MHTEDTVLEALKSMSQNPAEKVSAEFDFGNNVYVAVMLYWDGDQRGVRTTARKTGHLDMLESYGEFKPDDVAARHVCKMAERALTTINN